MKLENRDLSIGTGGDGHTRQESGEVKVWEGGGRWGNEEAGEDQSKQSMYDDVMGKLVH